MKDLDWLAVVLSNDLLDEHGEVHALLAIDMQRCEVVLKADVYDPLAVWNFVRGRLLQEFEARVFDTRDDAGVHAVANHKLSIYLAGTLFPVSFFTHASGAVSSRLGNAAFERQRRCDESRLGVMQALRDGGCRAALLADGLDEWNQTALQVLVDYEAPDFTSVFELGDMAETGAYFDVPVEVVSLHGLLKPGYAEKLLRLGFTTLSDDGTQLEPFDGSPQEIERWIQRRGPTP